MSTAPRPPSPPPGPLGGHLLPLRRNPPRYLLQAARTYGEVVLLRLGPIDVYVLTHPDFVRDVLVTHHAAFGRSWEYHVMKRLLGQGLLTTEGEVHRRQRKLVLPAFHHSRIAAYADVMVQDAERRSAAWRPGQEVEMAAEMTSLNLSIVGRTLFGNDLETEARVLNRNVAYALEAYYRMLNPLRYAVSWLPSPTMLRFWGAKRRLDATVYRMIREYRAHDGDQGTLLALLLQARHEDDGTAMTDEEVRDQAMTLLLAGHETTAMALTWTWYLLAQHPEAEARLHAELDAALGDRPLTMESLAQLPYTRQVFTEALRLYPPAWTLARRADADLAAGPYTVPKGATVFLSAYLLHRDARFFPEPDRFLPERWTPEMRKALPKHAFFPFGSGPRVCIGEQFAWMNGLLVLATLARRWRPRLVPGQEVVPVSRLTLRPARGIRMTLEPRPAG